VRTKVGLGGSGEKYVLVLSGDDPQALSTAARNVERDLRTIPASQHRLQRRAGKAGNCGKNGFRPCSRSGRHHRGYCRNLRIATLGDYDWSLPKLNLAQRQVPVVETGRRWTQRSFGAGTARVPSGKAGSGSVMVSQVADLELSSDLRSLTVMIAHAISILKSNSPACRWRGDWSGANLPSIRNLPRGKAG